MTKHYITNKMLFPAVVQSKADGKINPELAAMFMKLVKRYGTKPNFAGYTYIEDMQAFALLNLCQHWHKFDETRFTNAFAYYTQFVHNSFLQFLKKEHTQRDIRDAVLISKGLEASFSYVDREKYDDHT